MLATETGLVSSSAIARSLGEIDSATLDLPYFFLVDAYYAPPSDTAPADGSAIQTSVIGP